MNEMQVKLNLPEASEQTSADGLNTHHHHHHHQHHHHDNGKQANNSQTICDNNSGTGLELGAEQSPPDDEIPQYDHQCYICDKTFSANSNLNRHLRKIHKENVQSPYNNVRCALCESLFSSSSMYTDHLEKDHKVAITTERLNFPQRQEFEEWKNSVENETTAQFIKSRGEKRTKSVNKTYYSCNRSGYYVSKARTQKALKKQGSRKINGRCPASINVTVNPDSSYDVRFIKTHVGHDLELKHLDLSDKDRDLILNKLTAGVTKREIIRQIRSTAELHQTTAASSVSPATSVISANGTTMAAAGGLNGNMCQPIVINSRSSMPGCSEQQIEVVVPSMETNVVVEITTTTTTTTPPNVLTTRSGCTSSSLPEMIPTPVKNETVTTTPSLNASNSSTTATAAATTSTVAPISLTPRLQLATTKDIHNIINSKHLDSKKIRHNYDLNTVDAWVEEMRSFEPQGSRGCVLLYKDQDNLVERFPKLRKLDFMLAIMKDGQADILKQLGPKCIVIDSTHHVHCEYLQVTYLSVIDEDNKGFPVAYLLSSRTDLETLEVFFSLVRERAGCISTRMLIADDLHDFYQAWWRIMSMPVHNLLTPWCVFDCLSKKFDLIRSREKLRKLKKQLRSLLTETEQDKFTSCLNQMLTDYKKDQDTCKFIESFEEKYARNPDIWSNSFRKSHGVSNYQLWNMHEKFKTLYKEGKSSKKMCKYITCLMNLFEESQLQRLLQIEDSHVEVKRRGIDLRHKKGVESGSLVYELAVEPAYWLCPSECSSEVYDEVRQNTDREESKNNGSFEDSGNGAQQRENNDSAKTTNAAPDDQTETGAKVTTKPKTQKCCELVCQEDLCKTCRHEYKCTCLDYVVGFNMCKHIHRISALCKQGYGVIES